VVKQNLKSAAVAIAAIAAVIVVIYLSVDLWLQHCLISYVKGT